MNNKITFPQLVDMVAKAASTSKRMSELFLKELFAIISERLLAGENVTVKNLGTFKLSEVHSRKSVDVNTGDAIEIPGHKRLSFVPDDGLAKAVNVPFAAFETTVLSDDVTDDQLQAIDDNEPTKELEPVDTVTEENDDVKDGSQNDAKPKATDENVELPPPFPVPPANVPIDEPSDAGGDGHHPINDEQQKVESDASVEADTTNDAVETTNDENVEAMQRNAGVDTDESHDAVDEAADTEDNTLTNNHTMTEHENQSPDNEEKVMLPSDYTRMEHEKEKQAIAHKSLFKGFVLGVLITVLVGGIVLYAISLSNKQAEPAQVISDSTAIVEPADEQPLDSNDVPKSVNDTAKAQPVPKAAATQSVKSAGEQAFKPIAIDTVKSTTYLTRLASRYYGKSCFWVYIYQENSNVIKNPNNIRPGTVLVIPAKEKYGIDRKNPESVKKAKVLEAKIQSKYLK